MVAVFSFLSKVRRWHDVGGGIHAIATVECCVKRRAVALDIEGAPFDGSDSSREAFPRVNAVKKFEKESAEEDLLWFLAARINDVVNEILTYPIRSTVDVGKSMLSEYRIVRPLWFLSTYPTHENPLAFVCKAPIARENRGNPKDSTRRNANFTKRRGLNEHHKNYLGSNGGRSRPREVKGSISLTERMFQLLLRPLAMHTPPVQVKMQAVALCDNA